MTRLMPASLRLSLLILAIGVGAAHGQSQSEVESQLAGVQDRISELQRRLGEDLARQDELTSRLAATEKEISQSSRSLQNSQQSLGEKQNRLAELRSDKVALQDAAAAHKEQLARQANMALASARRPAVQVLFGQTSPGELGRAVTYLTYLSRARSTALSEAEASIDQLTAVSRAIDGEIDDIQRVKAQLEADLAQLEAQRDERTRLLSQLSARVTTAERELATLQADAQRLEELLEQLMAEFADIPDGIDAVDFRTLKGKLPWPADGTIRHRYGQRRQAEWKWQGIVLSGSAGDSVSAIAYGRVAFADWLRGYGLLIIVDHGNNFHSLYGFNDTLYRDVGDWVGPGEPLAGIGASGGQSEPGLYFELRQQGSPVNPESWLLKR